MTNRERYKQAFSALHAPNRISLEESNMKKRNLKFNMRPVLAACLCAVILMGCMGAAYAADVGGIRETIRLWIGGRQTEAQVTDTSGGYQFTVPGEDGSADFTFGGGGVVIEGGSTWAQTPDQVADNFATQVDVDGEGRIWLYRRDQAYDITNLLDGGACKVSLPDGDGVLYFDIEDNGVGGYRFSMRPDPIGAPGDYIDLTE